MLDECRLNGFLAAAEAFERSLEHLGDIGFIRAADFPGLLIISRLNRGLERLHQGTGRQLLIAQDNEKLDNEREHRHGCAKDPDPDHHDQRAPMQNRLDDVRTFLMSPFGGKSQRSGESKQEKREQEGQRTGGFHFGLGRLRKYQGTITFFSLRAFARSPALATTAWSS